MPVIEAFETLLVLFLFFSMLNLTLLSGFEIPQYSRFSSSDEMEKIQKVVHEELQPVMKIVEAGAHDLKAIKQYLNIENAEKLPSRFAQISPQNDTKQAHDVIDFLETLNPGTRNVIEEVASQASSAITSGKGRSSTADWTPEKIMGMIATAMMSQPADFNYNKLSRVLQNWSQRISSMRVPGATPANMEGFTAVPVGGTPIYSPQYVAQEQIPAAYPMRMQQQYIAPQGGYYLPPVMAVQKPFEEFRSMEQLRDM